MQIVFPIEIVNSPLIPGNKEKGWSDRYSHQCVTLGANGKKDETTLVGVLNDYDTDKPFEPGIYEAVLAPSNRDGRISFVIKELRKRGTFDEKKTA